MKINPEIGGSIVAGLTDEEQRVMKEQTGSLEEKEIRDALQAFLEAEGKMRYSSIQQLPLELAVIDVITEG